ncbi:MAG: hypothetical protein WC196_06195 [Bacilli bacterium]
MEVKTRIVADNFWAYCCPRCDNGTMAWERDKADEPAFLKCVLCGKEVHQEKFYKKSGKKSSKEAISEANSAQQGQEKPAKKDYKWRFTHVQK